MNYLAHGRGVTDNPLVLAGTAAPGWLRACRRRSRLRLDLLPAETVEKSQTQLLRGIRKHFADNHAFHATLAFEDAQREVAKLLRTRHPTIRRTNFLAHILVEVLLDAWLLQRDPTLADRYYASLDRLDLDPLVAWLNQWATEPAPGLASWIEGFRRIQFLRTYGDDGEVAARLEAVARRVSLPALPPGFHRAVHAARLWIRPRAESLLAGLDSPAIG